jgi:hypothetical protein
MTKDEVVSIAQIFVENKYPMVPPVSMVQHGTVRQLGFRQRLHLEVWMRFGGSTEMRYSSSWPDPKTFPSRDVSAVLGKWLVAFSMSWHTDAAGMPQTLLVTVDDLDESVTQISPE